MVDIYRSSDSASPAETINAQVQLGDWYMLFSRPNAAMDEYKRAYQALEESELKTEYEQKLFGKPRALPDMPLIESETSDPNAPHDIILVKFDVSDRGEVRNVDFLDTYPSSVSNRAMIRRNLRNAKFRPRMQNGEPVYTSGIIHRYILPRT